MRHKADGSILLVALWLGIILGGIEGLGTSLYTIALNRYAHYGMYRLIALGIQEGLLVYIPVFCGGMAGIVGGGVFASRRWGRGRDRSLYFAALAVIGGGILVPVNLVLKSLTDYSLWRGARVAVDKVLGMFAGEFALAELRVLIGRRPLELLLGASGIAVVVVLCVAASRVHWSRVEDIAVGRLRVLRAAALAWLILLGGLSVGLPVHASLHPPRGPNLIVMVVDCMRHDHLGCYGYERSTSPNIDALAGAGVRFTRAYSSAPWTRPSIATAFTSLHPNTHGVVGLFDMLPLESLTVAEILRNHGYETMFLNGGNANISDRFHFSQGFDVKLDLPAGTNARRLAERFTSFRDRLKKGPFLAYLHYMDVHLPYHRNHLTSFFTGDLTSDKFTPGALAVNKIRHLASRREVSESDREYLVGLYDGEIRFVDESLMSVIEFLRDEDLFDDTVLFITSDHGEEFWDHGNFEHGHSLYEELIHIPMIVVGGDIGSGRADSCIGLMDLTPTLLDLAGLTPGNHDFSGRSFSDILRGHEPAGPGTPLFAMGTLYGRERYCLIEGDRKIILNTPDDIGKLVLVGHESPAGTELYGLSTDPEESNDLMKAAGEVERETVSRLEKELEALMKAVPRFEGRRVLPDEKLKEHLRSLGYL